ncbi:MAG: SMR family transporter [Gammaproteobacteria bacterium]|jgi:quaternary ammonium compound-resistance protein SugE|nr:SMR family transporter [Gammaproteobacteria bacterium]
MNWGILVVAGFFEIGWAVGLKYTHGFTRPWPTVGTAILGIVLLDESASPMRLLSLGLIVAGIVGLKLATPA